MLSPKIYSFQVPANGSFPLLVTGRYFRINSCTNPLAVTLDGIGTLSTVAAGQGLKLRDKDQPFTRMLFTDSSGAANNVTIIVADADFVDNTVLGTVNVVDGGKARTLAGSAFSGYGYQTNVAAQYPAVQLYNVNSGKNLIVSQIVGLSTLGAWMALVKMGPSLGTLPTYISQAASKKAGGATSTAAQLQSDSQPGASITGGTVLGQIGGQAGLSNTYKLTEPIVIPPNYGLRVVITNAVNLDLGATFEFSEELVQ